MDILAFISQLFILIVLMSISVFHMLYGSFIYKFLHLNYFNLTMWFFIKSFFLNKNDLNKSILLISISKYKILCLKREYFCCTIELCRSWSSEVEIFIFTLSILCFIFRKVCFLLEGEIDFRKMLPDGGEMSNFPLSMR